jgi:hypothetical protein
MMLLRRLLKLDITFEVIKTMKNLLLKFLFPFFVAIATGCGSTVDTNKVVEIHEPTIGVTDSIADVEIKDPISGVGCARNVLAFLNFGDDIFLNTTGYEPSSTVDRAKTAAQYNALRGVEKTVSATEILVHPVYSVVTKDPLLFPFLVHDVCVQVRGYRGVIKGFKQATTTSLDRPNDPKKQSFWFNFSLFK